MAVFDPFAKKEKRGGDTSYQVRYRNFPGSFPEASPMEIDQGSRV